MSESIYKACRHHLGTNKHILSNSYVFDWESDLFALTKAGYAIEVEVKISRSDFLADFKKVDKHHLLSNHKRTHSIWRKSSYASIWGYGLNSKYGKLHGEACAIDFCKTQTKIPNRFYYACPAGLITLADLPAYAGLLWVDETGRIKQVKQAPLLHKLKNIQEGDLVDKYYWRVHNSLREIFMAGDVEHLEAAKHVIKRIKNILQ